MNVIHIDTRRNEHCQSPKWYIRQLRVKMRAFEKEAPHGTTVAAAGSDGRGAGGGEAAGAFTDGASAHRRAGAGGGGGAGREGGRRDRCAPASESGDGVSVAASLRGARQH